MAIRCPKCQTVNPSDSKYCKECAALLPESEDMEITETLDAPKEDLSRGTTFSNRYEIIEELGRGGMGRVYRAEDTRLKQEIALKLIRPDIAAHKKTIERFRNELKAARMIVHKNVCRMFDLGESEGAYFITMEYIRGEDLKSMIRMSGQLGIGTAISIARQICDGLAEAHKLGVVHRDLKPSNIMIDKDGNARIMDFGIARSVEGKSITGAGAQVGTPEYMSPEQVESKEIDQRSDIYSLGVMLYEMVTGKVPFEGDTALSVAYKHRHEAPDDPRNFNDQIPERLRNLILKCLAKAREKRYQNTEEVFFELAGIEKGIPPSEKVISPRKPITSREITVTFGLKKLFVPSLIIIVFIISAVLLWKFFPHKEPLLAPKIKNSIAVISFENHTGDDSFDYLQIAIPNLLITNLENTGYLHVATWERLQDLSKQKKKERTDIIDRDLGFELCRLEGIEAIVLGTFTKAGEMFVTDVKVLDTETKKLLKSASSRGLGEQSILENQIDELSREISRGMGINRQIIEQTQIQIMDVATSSLEAYKYFLIGRESKERLYWEDAHQALQQAIEIDPTFASAYILLSEVYTGMQNLKARNESLRKAKLYSEKASEKERLLIDAWHAEFIDEDRTLRSRLLEKLVQKYPREKRFHMDLAEYYGDIKSEKAIEEYEKVLELDPSFGLALNEIGYAYAQIKEDYGKAIEYFAQYKSLHPKDANPFDSTGDMYFYLGKLDEAVLEYKNALRIKPDFYFSKIKIGYVLALKENYLEAIDWINQFIAEVSDPGMKAIGYVWKGFFYYWLRQFNHSMENLDLAAENAKTVENRNLLCLADLVRAWIHYDKGEYSLSLSCFQKIKESNIPFFKILHSLGSGYIELEEGQFDLAKIKLSEMDSVILDLSDIERKREKFYHDLFHAEILLAEKSIENAAKMCENAASLGRPYAPPYIPLIEHNIPFQKDVLARIYQHAGQIDKAIAEYEELIRFDPNRKERWLIHPLYYFRLASLYQQQGNNDKAGANYEKFLDLWKDADPGLFEVEDARKRLVELRSF